MLLFFVVIDFIGLYRIQDFKPDSSDHKSQIPKTARFYWDLVLGIWYLEFHKCDSIKSEQCFNVP